MISSTAPSHQGTTALPGNAKGPYTVVFASNQRGVLPLSMALWSLVDTAAPSTVYDIQILSDGIEEGRLEELREVVAKVSPRHSVSWINMTPILDEHIKSDFGMANSGNEKVNGEFVNILLPRSAWSRIFISELLPDVKRVLYADIDVLVCGDCSPLFEVDMHGAALGAVYEIPSSPDSPFNDKFNIPVEYPGYFNSGILVMDLEVFRRENHYQRILDCAVQYRGKLVAADQDVLNAALYPSVYRLHPRWNWNDGATRRILQGNPDAPLWRAIEPKEAIEASYYPGILHFIGPHKPWRYNHRFMRKRYEDAIRRSGLPGFLPIPGWNLKDFFKRLMYAPMYMLVRMKMKRLAKKFGITPELTVETWGVAEDVAKQGWPCHKK